MNQILTARSTSNRMQPHEIAEWPLQALDAAMLQEIVESPEAVTNCGSLPLDRRLRTEFGGGAEIEDTGDAGFLFTQAIKGGLRQARRGLQRDVALNALTPIAFAVAADLLGLLSTSQVAIYLAGYAIAMIMLTISLRQTLAELERTVRPLAWAKPTQLAVRGSMPNS